jgi:hypothetical protein
MKFSGEWKYRSTVPHCPRGRRSRYTLGRRLGGPQSRSGRCGVEKNIFPLSEIKHRPSIPQTAAIPTELSRLQVLVLWYICGYISFGDYLLSELKYIVACRAVAMQRPRDGRICKDRFCATAQ